MGVLLNRDKSVVGTTRRGGARPGAGRPPKTTSQAVKSKIVAAINAHQKETGKPFWKGLVELAWSADRDLDRIKAYQIILENLVAKESAKSINVSQSETGPAIVLPEQLPDTAEKLKVVSRS